MLPFAWLEDQLLRGSRYGFCSESPYVALVESEYEEGSLSPVLGFTLGAPVIAVPQRVFLSPEALRVLAVGQIIMTPLIVEFEES
jgi:hypothetical protein